MNQRFGGFRVVQTIKEREHEILTLIRRERERRLWGKLPDPGVPWYRGSTGVASHHAFCAEPSETALWEDEWLMDETIGGDPSPLAFHIMLQAMSGRCKPASSKRKAWRQRQINVRGLVVHPFQASWYCPVVRAISIGQRRG